MNLMKCLDGVYRKKNPLDEINLVHSMHVVSYSTKEWECPNCGTLIIEETDTEDISCAHCGADFLLVEGVLCSL